MPRTYTTEILGVTYTYRGATRGELEEALHLDQPEMEDLLCSKCLISPKIEDWDNILAGIPRVLARCIEEKSGLTEEGSNAFQVEVNEWVDSPSGKLEILMMGCLHMTPEVIKNLDPADWFKAATAAQITAVTIYGMDVEKFMNAGQPNKRELAQQALRQTPGGPGQMSPLGVPVAQPSGTGRQVPGSVGVNGVPIARPSGIP